MVAAKLVPGMMILNKLDDMFIVDSFWFCFGSSCKNLVHLSNSNCIANLL